GRYRPACPGPAGGPPPDPRAFGHGGVRRGRTLDLTWIDKMVHPTRWNRYTASNSAVLEQELFPISITITGNVAVAQYRYAVARENYKKETIAGVERGETVRAADLLERLRR